MHKPKKFKHRQGQVILLDFCLFPSFSCYSNEASSSSWSSSSSSLKKPSFFLLEDSLQKMNHYFTERKKKGSVFISQEMYVCMVHNLYGSVTWLSTVPVMPA